MKFVIFYGIEYLINEELGTALSPHALKKAKSAYAMLRNRGKMVELDEPVKKESWVRRMFRSQRTPGPSESHGYYHFRGPMG